MKAEMYVVGGNFYLRFPKLPFLFTDTELNRAKHRFERFVKNKETFRFYGFIEIEEVDE